MEVTLLYASLALFFTIFLIHKHLSTKTHHHLPPSLAPPLPILGHLHLLKQPLHRTFRQFSQTYGPIFSLKLGGRRVVVVSSPSLVEEYFNKNNIVFSNRPHVMVNEFIGYKHTTIAGILYGHQWRSLYRMAAQENMIIAGTDTSVVTIEWAMSPLLNHPDALQKAKLEIDSQVGNHRLIEEQDLPNLNYLRNIIFETFRMFPAGPLTVPRESSVDCKVGRYDIPHGTILMVNAWAIHRDPEVWDRPTEFKPERFEGKDQVETQKLMPFGMGRRACPGAGLGNRTVGLALGALIQCFEWERVSEEEVDLAEGVGLTMPKLKPLEAMCRPREIMRKVLEEASP